MTRFAARYGPWGLVAGASSGLGAAFVRAMAGRGLNVVAVARRGSLLEELRSEVTKAHGVEVRPLVVDLADPAAARTIAEQTEELDLGLLVYNAAYAPVGSLLDRDVEELARVVDVNVRTPLLLARRCGARLAARGAGGIVLMSSLAGEQGAPRIAAYAASKAFNTVLAEGLWHELREAGVDVVASCAGAIRTPNYEAVAAREAPGTLDASVVAERTLDGLGRGARVVPGLTNRIASSVMRKLLPRRAAIAIMARSTKELS